MQSMCGISGLWRFSETREHHQQDVRIIDLMNQAMVHRGPDSEGIWGDQNSGIVLGHRRLRIIDTTQLGDQPMHSSSNRYCIVFNGEIYNYRSLANYLSANGIALRGGSDTEVLVELFELLGPEMLASLDGMFAFAIFDKVENRLFVARDRMGEKPLYWCVRNDVFYFSSELKPLMAIPNEVNIISSTSIVQYLFYRYVPAPATIIKDIFKLASGECMYVSRDGNISINKWYEWKARPKSTLISQEDFNGVAEQLKKEICESLERRLIADVPVGLFLSSGIDSSLVAAMTSRLLGKKLESFSYGVEGDKGSEHIVAEFLAKQLGHSSNTLVVNSQKVLDCAKEIGYILDEPLADRSLISQSLISSFAKSKVTVCLSGDGGDELFGGYGRYVSNPLQRRGRVGNPIDTFTARYYSDSLPVFSLETLFLVFPDAVSDLLASLFHQSSGELGPNLNSLNIMRTLDGNAYLPNAVLNKVDRATMAFSLESRTPFLDPKVLRSSSMLPPEYCIGQSGRKLILRQILYSLLEEEERNIVLNRPKAGFGVGDILFKSQSQEVSKLLEQALHTINKLGIIKHETIKMTWFRRGITNINALWSVVVLGQWLDSLEANPMVDFRYE